MFFSVIYLFTPVYLFISVICLSCSGLSHQGFAQETFIMITFRRLSFNTFQHKQNKRLVYFVLSGGMLSNLYGYINIHVLTG